MRIEPQFPERELYGPGWTVFCAIAEADLELTIFPPHPLNAGIIRVHHHAWLLIFPLFKENIIWYNLKPISIIFPFLFWIIYASAFFHN